jgi:phosphate:Na+ symporter
MDMDGLGWLPFLLAGLAFFFLGLDSIKDALRGLASRSMRARAAAAVGSPFRAALLGVSFGAVSQSATAVSFVLAGLVTAGLLPARRALSVVAWANPGTALLAYLAAVNLELATLWLIGLVGLSLRSSRLSPMRAGLQALLGVGLLLFGLVEIKRAASPIQGAEWFVALTSVLQAWLPLCFLLGAALRLLIQSSSGIVVILIALCGKGLLQPEHALMVIHGTGVGIGLTVILLGGGLHGEARRIALWQAILNAVASIALGLWLSIAALDWVPSLMDLLRGAGMPLETALAAGYTAQMLLCPVIGALLAERAMPLLERLAPERREDSLAKPIFLSDEALETPDVAMELVEREQRRMAGAMHGVFAGARLDAAAIGSVDAQRLATSLGSLGEDISEYLTGLSGRAMDSDSLARLRMLGARHQALMELLQASRDLASAALALPEGTPARALAGQLIEAADAMLHTLHDAMAGSDSLEAELLLAMTADRSEQMEDIRLQAARGALGGAADQSGVLYATSMYERCSYLARRCVEAMGSRQVAESA